MPQLPASDDLGYIKYFPTLKVQLTPCSFFHGPYINGVTKLKYMFGLFRNYSKSLNLEGEIHAYVYVQRISVIVATLQQICVKRDINPTLLIASLSDINSTFDA